MASVKFLKEPREYFSGNANALVCHLRQKLAVLLIFANYDLAPCRAELNSVVEQIGDHLAQRLLIASNSGQSAIQVGVNGDILFGS
jgi:hypothetical protein